MWHLVGRDIGKYIAWLYTEAETAESLADAWTVFLSLK